MSDDQGHAAGAEGDVLARIGGGSTPMTAASFGAAPLREAMPDAFAELCASYGDLLDHAVEERAYRLPGGGSGEPGRALTERLGFLWARPRDLVEIHTAAYEPRVRAATAPRVAAYAEEGRLLLLEIMGGLVNHYRKLSLGRGT